MRRRIGSYAFALLEYIQEENATVDSIGSRYRNSSFYGYEESRRLVISYLNRKNHDGELMTDEKLREIIREKGKQNKRKNVAKQGPSFVIGPRDVSRVRY